MPAVAAPPLTPPLGAAALAPCEPLPVPAWFEVDDVAPEGLPPELGGLLTVSESELGVVPTAAAIVPSGFSAVLQLLQKFASSRVSRQATEHSARSHVTRAAAVSGRIARARPPERAFESWEAERDGMKGSCVRIVA